MNIKNRTFILKNGQSPANSPKKWRAIDEILLASLEHAPAFALDGLSVCIRMAHFLPGVAQEKRAVANHVHDIIHIQFVLAGRFLFKTGKRAIRLNAGEGIVIPAGRIHSWSCARAGVMFGASVSVEGRFAADFMEHAKLQAGPCSHPELLEGLARIVELALKPAPYHWRREMAGLELSLWMARTLHAALDLRPWKTPVPYRRLRQADPSRRLCEEAVRFLASNFSRPIKVRDAAGHVGVTARHMDRLFRMFLRVSPRAFLLQTRMEHAEKMLKSSPAVTIKETAFACGFHNPSYFSQCFRRRFGRAPTGIHAKS